MAMLNCNWNWLALLSVLIPALAYGATSGDVQYNRTDFSLMPTNLLASNIMAGANLEKSQGAKGRITLALSNTVVIGGQLYTLVPTNGVAPPSIVLQPVGMFGSITMSTTNNTYGAQNAYVVLTNYTACRTNGFYCNLATGYMTNQYAGFYPLFVTISILPGNGDTIEGEFFFNDTEHEEFAIFGTWDNPARVRTITAAGGVHYIPANTGISFRVNNRSGTNTASIWRASVTVGTP